MFNFNHAVYHTITLECLFVGTLEACKSYKQVYMGLCGFINEFKKGV